MVVAISAFSPTRIYSQDTTSQTLRLRQLGKKAIVGINALAVCDTVFIASAQENTFVSWDSCKTWTELAAQLPHKTVVDIAASGDTVFVLAANGSTYRTTNHGLTWGAFRKHGGTPTPNVFQKQGDSLSTVFVAKPQLTATYREARYSVTDSTITIESPCGIVCRISSGTFTEASCIAVSDEAIYLGCRRQGILAVQMPTYEAQWMELGGIKNEYINTLAAYDGYVYIGILSGMGGIYRKAERGTALDIIHFDRAVEAVDILCLRSSSKGVYVGTREYGISYIPRNGHVAYQIHSGLLEAVSQNVEPLGTDLLLVSRLRGVMRIQDCGAHVEPFTTSLPMSGEYIACSIGNNVVVGITEGYLLRSRNNGRTWDTLSLTLPPSSINRIRSYEGALYVCTGSGLFVSRDTGSTWTEFLPKLQTRYINNIFQIPGGWMVHAVDTVFIVNSTGDLKVFAPKGNFRFTPLIHDVAVHEGTVYAAGYPGLFVSADGGVTWEVYYIDDVVMTRTITIVDSTFYITSVQGRIYQGTLPIRR